MKRPSEHEETASASKKPKVTGAELFKQAVLDKYRRRDFWESDGGREGFINSIIIARHERRTMKDRAAATAFMFWVVRQGRPYFTEKNIVKQRHRLPGISDGSRRRYVAYAILKALTFGADPNARDAVGNTILFYNLRFHYENIVKAFVDVGGDVNARNKFGETAMHYSQADRSLKRYGADVNATDRWGDTPLHTAARLFLRDKVESIIELSDVNAVNHKGQTPLFHAIYHPRRRPRTLDNMFAGVWAPDQDNIIELLLKYGADVNHADMYGRTPMHVAAMRGDKFIAERLARHGASIHAVDRSGRTPLAYLARAGHRTKDLMVEVEQWTTLKYRNVRNARLTGPTIDNLKRVNGLKINQALATFFRNSAPRMPDVPAKMKRPKFLYRGIHGPDFDMMTKHGYIIPKSYIATTRSLSVARRFSYGHHGIILKIPFESIPHGTPMVWFADKRCKPWNRQARSSCEAERETLLPPGRLEVVRKDGNSTWEARYTPDASARAKYNTKPMMRQTGRARRNINNTGPLPPWMQMSRLFRN